MLWYEECCDIRSRIFLCSQRSRELDFGFGSILEFLRISKKEINSFFNFAFSFPKKKNKQNCQRPSTMQPAWKERKCWPLWLVMTIPTITKPSNVALALKINQQWFHLHSMRVSSVVSVRILKEIYLFHSLRPQSKFILVFSPVSFHRPWRSNLRELDVVVQRCSKTLRMRSLVQTLSCRTIHWWINCCSVECSLVYLQLFVLAKKKNVQRKMWNELIVNEKFK